MIGCHVERIIVQSVSGVSSIREWIFRAPRHSMGMCAVAVVVCGYPSQANEAVMLGFNILSDPLDIDIFALAAILYFLGAWLVKGNAKLELAGKRIALAAFFLFVALVASEMKPTEVGDWVAVLIRSLVLSGIVLGAGWTVLPLLSFGYANTFGAAFQRMRSWTQAAKRHAEARSADRERRSRDAEWERDRPRREREAHEAALRAEAEARAKGAAQKRREDARSECDALYALAAPEINGRFNKQEFSEFVSKYMTDAVAPEVVEERAEQLKGIIQHHWERIEPPRQSLKELSEWFEQRMAELQSVSDERLRKSLIVQLKVRYTDLTTNMLSEMSP